MQLSAKQKDKPHKKRKGENESWSLVSPAKSPLSCDRPTLGHDRSRTAAIAHDTIVPWERGEATISSESKEKTWLENTGKMGE